MFIITERKGDGFDKVILKNKTGGCYAGIVPDCGGILLEYGLEPEEGPALNVLDGFTSKEHFDNHVEEAGFMSCKLSPFVCRLENASYTFADQEYHVADPWEKPNALHGLLYKKPFSVVSKQADESGATLILKYEYRGENPGYPFSYDCVVTYALDPENSLSVVTECFNRDKGLIPLQDGWHPYFKLGERIDDLQLEFQVTETVVFNSGLLPTGEFEEYDRFSSLEKIGDTQLDNCFRLNFDTCQPLCVLRNKDSGIEIQIFPEKSYPYLQIYTPPHRKSIAIENLTGPPNGFNNHIDLITVEPGKSARFATRYKINPLKSS